MADALASTEWHALSGWGGSVHAVARVVRPRDADEVAAVLAAASERGVTLTPRGAGRSYGDAALPPEAHHVLDLRRLDRIPDLDARAGRVTVEAGVTVERLWRHVIGHGWWPAVVPGTMRPTLGGCAAMNVHGKNQYRVGAFGEHVERLTLVSPTGTRRDVDATRDGDLFRAVIGGAGLLGVVTDLTLRLHRVDAPELAVTAQPVESVERMVALLDERRHDDDYLVGWLDAFDRRARGVVHSARYVPAGDGGLDAVRQDLPERILGVVPRDRAALLLRPLARPAGIRALNAAKRVLAGVRGPHAFRQAHAAFHFLLDYVPRWRSVYAPGGLLQHQSFVPAPHAAAVLSAHLDRCRASGIVPWLAVVKRHRADDFLLTHNLDGVSLALDFPVTAADGGALLALCRAMDEDTLAAGGRLYLAKDQTALPASFARSVPGLERFRAWKRELDPAGVLVTAQARRLGLV